MLDGESYEVQVASGTGAQVVSTLGKVEVTGVKTSEPVEAKEQPAKAESKTSPAGGTVVNAPVNGVVFKILCSVGDKVEPSQTVIILESMKMEIDVKAGVGGTLASIDVAKGQNVEEGNTIFVVN